jgi:hypothetical protein
MVDTRSPAATQGLDGLPMLLSTYSKGTGTSALSIVSSLTTVPQYILYYELAKLYAHSAGTFVSRTDGKIPWSSRSSAIEVSTFQVIKSSSSPIKSPFDLVVTTHSLGEIKVSHMTLCTRFANELLLRAESQCHQ